MDTETLDTIMIGMQGAAKNDDFEIAHSNADGYLIALINLLAQSLSPYERLKVKAILEAYEEVGKWYA